MGVLLSGDTASGNSMNLLTQENCVEAWKGDVDEWLYFVYVFSVYHTPYPVRELPDSCPSMTDLFR